jgi:hypothetical protein
MLLTRHVFRVGDDVFGTNLREVQITLPSLFLRFVVSGRNRMGTTAMVTTAAVVDQDVLLVDGPYFFMIRVLLLSVTIVVVEFVGVIQSLVLDLVFLVDIGSRLEGRRSQIPLIITMLVYSLVEGLLFDEGISLS